MCYTDTSPESSDSNPDGSAELLQTIVEGFSNLSNEVKAGFDGLKEDNEVIKTALGAAKNDQSSVKPPPGLSAWNKPLIGSSPSKVHLAPEKDGLEKKLEIHRNATENWLAEKNSLLKECAELERRLRGTEHKNKELQKRVTNLSTQVQAVTSQNKEKEELIADLRAELLTARGFITKGSGNEQVERDEDLISSFVALKSKIQKIVHKHYLVEPSRIPHIHHMNAMAEQVEISKLWTKGLNASQLKKRVRAQIFALVDQYIFRIPSFGMVGIMEFEMPFSDFEFYLTQMSLDNASEIKKWASATIKLASSFLPDGQAPTSVGNAHYIHNVMYPFIHHKESTATNNDLFKLVHELCDDAYKLAVKLRGSKSVFRTETPEEGSAVKTAEMEIADQEILGGVSSEDDVVAFTLFGMLVKYPENNPNERIILEKAEVVTTNPLIGNL